MLVCLGQVAHSTLLRFSLSKRVSRIALSCALKQRSARCQRLCVMVGQAGEAGLKCLPRFCPKSSLLCAKRFFISFVAISVVRTSLQFSDIFECVKVHFEINICLYASISWFHGVHRRTRWPSGLGTRPRVNVPRLWPSGAELLIIWTALCLSMNSTPRAI